MVHTALVEHYLFSESLMKKPSYSNDYYKKLCFKKDATVNKALIEIQFERIGGFDEKMRTNRIANAYPNIFKSPFKPCKDIF